MQTEQLPLRRWTVGDFDRMMELGLVAPRGYELLEGVVYNTQGFVKRWSIYDFDRLADAGVITPEERAELIAGSVFQPRSFRPLHASIRTRLNRLLFEATRDDASVIVSPTGYVLLDDETMVAPEIFVMAREAHENFDAWPGAGDVTLISEIVDPLYSTLLEMKRGLYAQFAIPELWYVDPVRGTVAVHVTPKDGEYRDVREYRRGETWASAALRGARLSVDEAVGRER
jgi:Uma2 family endonuclease